MQNLKQILLLLVATVWINHGFSQTSKAMAMLDLSPNKPVQKLFALTLLSINGESVTHRNDMIMLTAGDYHLTFYANIELKFLTNSNKIMLTKINQRKYQDSLDVHVEAGNIYHLAFDARSQRIEQWQPILLGSTANNP